MPLAVRDTQSVPASRLQALRARHSKIEEELDRESQHPSASEGHLKSLKKMKLSLKEEIEGIRDAS